MRRLFLNPYVLLAFASLCWSGNHVVARAVAGHVPPIAISTLRWLIPAFLLWPLARRRMEHDWPLIKQNWVTMLWLAITGGALFSALQYIGLQYTTAINVSTMNSLAPVLIVAAGGLLFRDRLHLVQAAGIATSLIGVLVIVARGTLQTLAELKLNWGDLVIIFNMLVFAVYSAGLRLRPSIDWLSFLFVLSVVSVIAQLPFAVWEALSGYVLQPTWATILTVAYVGIFPGLLAIAAWNRGVELVGANRAGPFLHLVPLYSAVLAGVLLGERLAVYHVVGFALILIGVWLASAAPTRLNASPQAEEQPALSPAGQTGTCPGESMPRT